ncbi:D-alanyl-D-alanine dipeptidase [Aquicella siphonis]|uniref:D-alanyl-D-alanine dipeptidase n=1 Tax=Aquicella siphonis TaxID=254247 RepID=A0A5E4PH86_9COXI|nr:M15 family metallopeptidase [Aquicella siphonis]VVC75681.1 D-alanyl-D-alanine dipeptidase [Aquicella siphonis]
MKIFRFLLFLFCGIQLVYALPPGFVYLSAVDSEIMQEMRYAGYHNFIGRPVSGYKSKVCILTRQAANALRSAQRELSRYSLSLKVYDCYRPVKAVEDFVVWSRDKSDQKMKLEFYPHVNKADVFKLGYVALRSGHSRGSTVDLTIVSIPAAHQPAYHPGVPLVSCDAPPGKRFPDNTMDMGTGFDCLDPAAHAMNREISAVAFRNRMLLRKVMIANGFEPYENEWWHFTFRPEPYPDTYFNFDVD